MRARIFLENWGGEIAVIGGTGMAAFIAHALHDVFPTAGLIEFIALLLGSIGLVFFSLVAILSLILRRQSRVRGKE